MLALVLIMGLTSLKVSSGLSRELDSAVNSIARKQLLAGQISTAAADMNALERGIAFNTVLQQPEKAEDFKRQYHAAEGRVEQYLESFKSLMNGTESKAELDTVQNEYAAIKSAHQNLL